ncbi:MAG: hypothetical protein H6809_03495 [Phycisphaeraceae bacterium]|nr:hypothetical protein [Phycisphaeraceae bacterium]
MTQATGVIKWTIYLAALLAVGPLAAAPMAALRDATGGTDATILVGTSLPAGLLAGIVPLLAAAAVGLLGARLVSPKPGMVAAGLVLCWAAWRSAGIDGLMRATRSAASIWPLAIEGAILGVIGIALGAIVWQAGTRHAQHDDAKRRATTTPADANATLALLRMTSLASAAKGGPIAAIGAALVAAGLGAWLLAQDPLKGQTIAAGVLAGIAAGGFSRAVASREAPPTPIPALIAMALLALIGPITAIVFGGGGSRLVVQAIQGDAFPLAMLMPFDWLAGAFWGIPIGLSWADSMVESHEK